MRETQKKTESQLNHLAELLQKIANQSLVNPQAQAQPSAPSPLPFQPLPNPKGGINAVQVEIDNKGEDEAEDNEGENDWLYELLKELANSDESDDEEEDENIEEESEEESGDEEEESEFVEEEDINDKDKGKIFFINTLFKEKKSEEEIPIKYLGPLKKSREAFTTADASIVSVVGIAENVLVKIEQLTTPADFHVIMPTKGNKGGRPQVLLGRPFLKTVGFNLIYYDEIFTFEVGNAIKIFHLPPPPKPRKNGLHHLQQDKGKKIKDKPWKKAKGQTRKAKKPMIKPSHLKEKHKKGKMEDDKGSDQKKKKKKKDRSGTEEREKEKLSEAESEKTTIKCSSFSRLMRKVKSLKRIIHRAKGADAHLVKNNSKWK
ncbi:hypothetical protein PIB30_065586 [Stylosanthes scabra]|uniref:Uncharacterized protein n=1 Tax=Stylosanthes scabra TaxID=79078 RepID=A0ABU6XMD6_9FABA|nr:hypothetical protein [Stylosanthes scabra]